MPKISQSQQHSIFRIYFSLINLTNQNLFHTLAMAIHFLSELKTKVPIINQVETLDISLKKADPYGDRDYWEKRYAESESSTFEWLITWSDLETEIGPMLCKFGGDSGKIMHVGCGNSSLGTEMRLAGFGAAGILK